MTSERIEFVGAAGSALVGQLHRPEGRAKGSVLLVHCFTCSKDLHTMTRLANGLSEAGYAAFRFDLTGLGESGGSFEDTTVGTTVADVTRAAVTLIERGFGPCGLLGHSFGGAAALLAAQRLKTVRSVVTLGAPSSPAHLQHLLGDPEQFAEADCVEVSIAGRTFPVSSELVAGLDRWDQDRSAGQLDRPLLVIHAVNDAVVPVTEGERLFAAARQPKGFLPLLAADHLVSNRADAEIVLHAVVDWFDRTLGSER